ncbi:MAG TPA: hypothetical protein VGB55_09380 [Tepidisphaeraceae bacterium]|jgi:hypothetical protein
MAALDLRRRFKAVLGKLDLLGLFEAVPAVIRDRMIGACHPDPALRFDSSFPSEEAYGGAYAAVRRATREEFAKAAVRIDDMEIAVRDFWAIVRPMAASVRRSHAAMDPVQGLAPHTPASLRAFLVEAAPKLAYVAQSCVEDAVYDAVQKAVIVPLVARGRLDTRLLHNTLAFECDGPKHRMILTLGSTQPAVKYVRLRGSIDGSGSGGGGSRPVYRVGTSCTWAEVNWLSWKRETVGEQWADRIGIAKDRPWEVYAQSHALKQLRQRLDVYAHADWAEHWMHESLSRPQIVREMSEHDLLVAYEAEGKRLGYLVVTARDGLVVVRTFLFLTMAQTPEGRMLRERLRLTQDELSYLRLHELSRFTHTDLKDDPAIRTLIEQCGCGQLFALAEDEDALVPHARVATPFAAELKQYVRLAA